MTILVSLAMVTVVFGVVVYPFWRKRLKPAVVPENEKLRELQSKRDTSYSMLKELEFDYASGILTEEDYRDLETRYKKKAITVLKEIDILDKSNPVEDEIEKRVMQLRQKRTGDDDIEKQIEKKVRRLRRRQETSAAVEDKLEAQVQELRQSRSAFCTQCGTKAREIDRFCGSCGSELYPKGGRVG
jgi:hypothetical protein